MTKPLDRIVVSGLGLQGPSISTAEEYWELLTENKEPRPVGHFDPQLDAAFRLFPVEEVEEDSESLCERLALSSARAAANMAALGPSDLESAGVYFGSTLGSIDLLESTAPKTSVREAHSLFELSNRIAASLGCYGPAQVVNTACSSSIVAHGLAIEALKDGQIDVAIVGGAEILSTIAAGAFIRIGGLDHDHCRPYDKHRMGAVLGQGAAALVLEREDYFRARTNDAVKPLAFVNGFGWSSDAHHATAPDPSGKGGFAAVIDALTRSHLEVDDIDCVLPHGTGTVLNDSVEVKMLQELFQDRLQEMPLLPIKAWLGHSAGASGAFAAIAATLILQQQSVPAAANCKNPGFDLKLDGLSAGERPINHILINAHAFGGNNACMIMSSEAL